MTALAIASVAVLVRFELPALASQQAVDDANDGNWRAALAPAEEAVRADPDLQPFHFTLGLAMSRVGDHAGAAREFALVANSDEYPEAWLNLGSELADLGRRSDALEAVRNALRLGYQRAAVAMPAGELALSMGDLDLASDAFGAAIVATTTLAVDPWWHTSPARTAMLPAAVESAIRQIDPKRAWEVAMLAGDSARAKNLAVDAYSPELAALVIPAWDGDAHSESRLFDECSRRPLDLDWLDWCGRFATRDGDEDAAAQYRLGAGLIIGGGDESSTFLEVATKQGEGRWTSGQPAAFWGYYTYRRPTPWDVLVPDLLHLVTK